MWSTSGMKEGTPWQNLLPTLMSPWEYTIHSFISIFNLDETGEFFKWFSLNYKNGHKKKQKIRMYLHLSQN